MYYRKTILTNLKNENRKTEWVQAGEEIEDSHNMLLDSKLGTWPPPIYIYIYICFSILFLLKSVYVAKSKECHHHTSTQANAFWSCDPSSFLYSTSTSLVVPFQFPHLFPPGFCTGEKAHATCFGGAVSFQFALRFLLTLFFKKSSFHHFQPLL